jgi:hypothetical protein
MAASPHVYGQFEDIKILRDLPVERNIAPGSAVAPAPSPHASAIQASSGYRHSQPGRFCNQPDSLGRHLVRRMSRPLLLRNREIAHAGKAPFLPATKDFDRSAPE